MPVYEYCCEHCGETVELRRRWEDRDAPLRCEGCGSGCRRIWTPTRNLFIKPWTGVYTRGELARMIAPETESEREIWERYG